MTTMVHIIGRHTVTGSVVSIYRQKATAEESVRLMRECGYLVTVQAGYTAAN
jgi:hypothetical protein